MIFYNISGSARLMEVVHVLSDNRMEKTHLLKFTHSQVRPVRPGTENKGLHVSKHVPDLFRVPSERIYCGIFFRCIL